MRGLLSARVIVIQCDAADILMRIEATVVQAGLAR